MQPEPVDLGRLAPLLDDPAVCDVLVNPDGRVWIEREGRLETTGLRCQPGEVLLLIERIVTPLGLRVDRARPVVEARLPDGSRVHAVVPPVACDGPCLAIRRFRPRAIGLHEMGSSEVADLLGALVAARWNLLVSGGTGAGKTTLLNALAGRIVEGERLVTVEDAAELRLRQPHVVRLEARPPNAEGAGAIDIRELVRAALRLRPDRLIIGEVRGAEAFDMVQAMNTGHDGSMSTVHANSPGDALRRLEALVLMAGVGLPLEAITEQIGSAVDGVIHVVRTPDGRRSVTEIGEVRYGPESARVRPLVCGGSVVAEPARVSRP